MGKATYPPSVPKRLFVIDYSNWDEYRYIGGDDKCFYIWERMAEVWRKGDYDEYPTNRLISNFQIPENEQNPWRYKHKRPAIEYIAKALDEVLPVQWRSATFVPMPCSKVKGSKEYDPRLLEVLRAMRPPLPDVRELVVLKHDVAAKQKQLRPEDRVRHYVVDKSGLVPEPRSIIILDDVLATGSHFKAVQHLIRAKLPRVQIAGVFLARSVRPKPLEDDDDDPGF